MRTTRQKRHSVLLVGSLLAFAVLCTLVAFSQAQKQICETNPGLHRDVPVLNVFEGCFRDTWTPGQIFVSIGGQFAGWFNGDTYCQAIMVFLLALPFVSGVLDEQDSPDIPRFAYYIIQGSLLLFRLSISNAMDPWLYCVFRQLRPCVCGTDANNLNQVGSQWGMPSGDVMVGTMLGIHVMERCNLFIGALIIIGVPIERVIIGYHSIGQVLVGLLFGVVLHFVCTRLPIIVSLILAFLNLLGGLVVLPLVKAFYLDVDFSWAVGFFDGLAWQAFALTILGIYFSPSFYRILLFKAVYKIEPVDLKHANLPVNMMLVSSSSSSSSSSRKSGDDFDSDRIPLTSAAAVPYSGGTDNNNSSISSTRRSSRLSRVGLLHASASDVNRKAVIRRMFNKKVLSLLAAMGLISTLCVLNYLSQYMNEILSFGRDTTHMRW